jgi:ATP-binding cassette subfamily C protein CydC
MLNTLRRLLKFAVPFRGRILLSVFWGFSTIATSIGLMATSAWLISKSGLQPSIAELGISVVAVRFFGVFRGVFRYMERLVSHDVTFRMLADIRVWFYKHLEPLAPARLAQFRSGDLLGRVVSDVETLQDLYTRVIAPPVIAIATAILMIIFFGIIDMWVMLAMLAFVLFASTLLPLMAWWQGRHFGPPLVKTRGELNAALTDSIQGLADALAFGYENQQQALLQDINEQYRRQETTIARYDSLQMGIGVLLVNLAAVVVLWVAIPRIDGIMLATVTLATIAAFEAFTPLAMTANHFAANIEAGQRLFEIVDSQPMTSDVSQPISAPQQASLAIQGLTFQYNQDDAPVLNDISLEIQAGEHVAIVGASGAGKSSLVNVLLRFWEFDQGQVLLDGQDIKQLAQDDVHRFFGVMSQRTHLFNTSIRENIHIARPTAEPGAIEQATQRAQIHDFIQQLPREYDTYVGEMGARLSGGERQRIALARMLLKDAPFFIFDEATANLDAVTESAVMQAILEATQDRTMLFITHRLTLLERMDRIVVLHEGRIVEQGSHRELAEQDGIYAKMLHLQQQIVAT